MAFYFHHVMLYSLNVDHVTPTKARSFFHRCLVLGSYNTDDESSTEEKIVEDTIVSVVHVQQTTLFIQKLEYDS